MINVETIHYNDEALVAKMARVSNPQESNVPDARLIAYLMKNSHWSPFEMVNFCVLVECPRDISRQILRHRSLHFQELSQRYADVTAFDFEPIERECRLQHPTNRQMSETCGDEGVANTWAAVTREVYSLAMIRYSDALKAGIAKEVARTLLPEGLTSTRMYINGTVRSWLHYLQVREDANHVQREHVQVANAIRAEFKKHFPLIDSAAVQAGVLASGA